MTRYEDEEYIDQSTMDGVLKAGRPDIEFNETFEYNTQPLLWGNKNNTNGTVSHLPNKSGKELKIAQNDGDKLTRQTRQYFQYVPGSQKNISFACDLPVQDSGVRARVGYWNDKDGAFLQQEGSTIKFVRRSNADGSVTDDAVEQKNWNRDKMDDTTPSNVNIDFTKLQMVHISYLWYGGGAIALSFQIGEQIFLAHVFEGSNQRSNPITGSPSLPLRYEIENTSSQSSDHTLNVFGGRVESVWTGGGQRNSFPFSADTGDTVVSISDSGRPVLSIRPKDTFNGQTNRATIEAQSFQVFSLDGPARYRVIKNASLTDGGSAVSDSNWNSVNTDSITESNTTADGFSGGRVIDSGIVPTSNQNKTSSSEQGQLNTREPLTLDVDNSNNDRLTLVIDDMTGQTNPTVYAKLSWREKY